MGTCFCTGKCYERGGFCPAFPQPYTPPDLKPWGENPQWPPKHNTIELNLEISYLKTQIITLKDELKTLKEQYAMVDLTKLNKLKETLSSQDMSALLGDLQRQLTDLTVRRKQLSDEYSALDHEANSIKGTMRFVEQAIDFATGEPKQTDAQD